MKRIQYHRYGGPATMQLEEFELKKPGTGQIVVRTKAASANPVDWKIRNGVMKFMTGLSFPRAMGSDFSGVVEAVGPSVIRIKVGDEVLGTTTMKAGGAFADKLITDEKLVVVKPAALSFVQAASLPIVGTTAWCGLVDKAQLKPGQSVFVHGCLGGVGRAASQLAVALGARVAGSCRGVAMDEARALGLHDVVDCQRFQVAPLHHQFDVVFDTAGTLSLKQGRALLKPDGVVLWQAIRNHAFEKAQDGRRKGNAECTGESGRYGGHRKLVPSIGKTVSLSNAIPALMAVEQHGNPKGKLVIHLELNMKSSFNARSTTDVVLKDINLAGKTVLLTGCNSGLDFETLRQMTSHGAHVVAAARNLKTAQEACAKVGGSTTPLACDLSDFSSVKKAIARVRSTGRHVDIVIANAGIMALPKLEQLYGLEKQFVVNYLSHFMLITGVLNTIPKHAGARIVILASSAHTRATAAGIEFENLSGHREYKPWVFYGQSNVARILFARALSRRLSGDGIIVNTLHPGVIADTNLARNLGVPMRALSPIARLFTKTIPQGAATQCYLAAHPEVASVTGQYFSDCKITEPSPAARDDAMGERLWALSEELIVAHGGN